MLRVSRTLGFVDNISYPGSEGLRYPDKIDFSKGNLHPMDLKNGVADSLIEILEPAREHFSKGNPKKMLEELNNLMIYK